MLTNSMEKQPTCSIEVFEQDFTLVELKTALGKCKKGRSAGPDRLTNEMLINLSDFELSTILKFTKRHGVG
jgi:hypothetical protein